MASAATASGASFAIYRDGHMVAGFALAAALLRPEFRPAALPAVDHLGPRAHQVL